MTPHDTALRLIVLKVLGEELAKAKAPTVDALREAWTVGDRNTGLLPSGTPVGTVTYKKGAVSAPVTDREAFTAWVRATHPGEIETVTPEPFERVRPAFEALLTNAAKKLGVAIDAETGEEVPGITVREGEPGPMVRLAPGAADLVAEAWRSGELNELVADLLRPAIPAAESPTHP